MADSFRAIVTILGPLEPGAHPDHELPPVEGPVDPGYGVGAERPSHPIVIRPPGGPVTIWPPQIDNSLPPPVGIWGGAPAHPDHGLPVPPISAQLPVFPGTPEHPIAAPPGTIWPPIPVHLPAEPGGGDSSKVVLIAWVPGVGVRYVVVDLSLKPDQGLPGGDPQVDPR